MTSFILDSLNHDLEVARKAAAEHQQRFGACHKSRKLWKRVRNIEKQIRRYEATPEAK